MPENEPLTDAEAQQIKTEAPEIEPDDADEAGSDDEIVPQNEEA